MKTILKNKLFSCVFIVCAFSLLTACHTVKGTVTGAGQDIQSVSRAINH